MAKFDFWFEIWYNIVIGKNIDNKDDMFSYYDSVAFMVLDDTVDCIDFENDFDNI